MQLRLGLGLGILVFFLVAGLLAGAAMKHACDPVARLLDQAAQEQDPGVAAQLAEKAQKIWQQHNHAIAALADHSPMDEINSLFAQAMDYLHTGNMEDFSSLCSRLSSLVVAVYEAHSLTWWNII